MTRPTKSSYYDVVILGAGPAGAATALSLRQNAPFLSIALIDRSKSSEFGKGETLPPTVRSTLERLGIWEAFLKEDHLPAYGACSSWGSDQLIENEFIFNPAARGWHLDRARFDAMLVRESVAHGVTVYSHSEFKSGGPGAKKKWQLSIKTPDQAEISIEAAFVVDATGRRADFAAQQQVRKVLLDRSVGLFVFFDFEKHAALTDTYTLVEACEDGWWYSAMLPGDKLVVACITDADIARKRELNKTSGWS